MALGARKQHEDKAGGKRKKLRSGTVSKPSSGAEKKGSKGGARFVLLVGDEGGILVYLQGKRVVRRLFAPSPQPSHIEAMVRLMSDHPKAPLSILMDVLDQQYVRQTFPPVSSLSVGGLVKRRLERDFQSEDLKGSIPLGRDKTGRKEWNFLLVSLAKTQMVSEWLDVMIEQPNPLKGVYLVPVEVPEYIRRLHKVVVGAGAKPWQLFVSHNKVSGFRQVVVHNDKMVFTRVTQAIDDAIAAVIAGNIEQEIINTLEYLRRLGFQDNKDLEVFVVVANEVADSLDMKRFSFGEAHVLSPLDVAEALGLEQAALSADRFGDVVMASAIATNRKTSMRLMTAYGEKLSKLYAAMKAVKAVMILGVLGFAGLTALNIFEIITLRQEVAESEARQRSLIPQKEALEKTVSGLNKDLAFRSAVVGAYEAMLKNAKNPRDFLAEINPFLSYEHRLLELQWGKPINGASSAVKQGQGNATKEAEKLEIRAVIQFDGNYADAEVLSKEATSYIEQLKAGLPQYDITAGSFPWLRESKSGIEISFDQQQDSAPSKEQSIVILTFSPNGKPPIAKSAVQPPVVHGGAP